MFMPLERPDEPAAAGLASGPRQASGEVTFEDLFRQHAAAVASVGLSMLQSAQEADDLVQDVFVKAWRAFDRLEDREAARPWLMTIAIRLARTRLRRRKLTRLLFLADDQEIERVAAANAPPEELDMLKRLYGILDRIPVDLRIAWVLRNVQQETVPTIAELCGWSLSTTKRRLRTAEERVNARLAALSGDSGR
jgi:RNA polymerase sigma-70 factor (ECF subfamily)